MSQDLLIYNLCYEENIFRILKLLYYKNSVRIKMKKVTIKIFSNLNELGYVCEEQFILHFHESLICERLYIFTYDMITLHASTFLLRKR